MPQPARPRKNAADHYDTPHTDTAETTQGSKGRLCGITLLAVAEKAAGCTALCRMAQASGARVRQAASLPLTRAHLRCYRPDAVIIDLGLAGGRGELIIRELALRTGRRPAILGISADTMDRGRALAAGADGFMQIPVSGATELQETILRLCGRPSPCSGPTPVKGNPALSGTGTAACRSNDMRLARILSRHGLHAYPLDNSRI